MSDGSEKPANDYVIRVLDSVADVPREIWNSLLENEADPSPFVRHEYLSALHHSGCAITATGWRPQVLTLWLDDRLQAACAIYLKSHSWGEYVFLSLIHI